MRRSPLALALGAAWFGEPLSLGPALGAALIPGACVAAART